MESTDLNKKILFHEIQKFRQWWLWTFLVLFNIFFLAGVYIQIIKGIPFGSKPLSNPALLLSTILFGIFNLFFYILKLETIIQKDGIYVRFFPFHLRFKHFRWEDLIKVYLREYSSISEFGGWGLRFKKNKTAYNVSGNIGLQLEFRNGKELLIGTNQPEKLEKVLHSIGVISKYNEMKMENDKF